MKSEVKNLLKSQIEITIEVSPEEMKPFLEKAAIKLSKEAKIEGFRPGKAPYEIVKQKVGEMNIIQEALDDIISKTYHDTLEQNKLVTIGQPKIDIEKLAPGNPLVYKATAAILPKVKIGDWKNIKLSRQPIKIDNKKEEKVIADIQKMRAKETLIERSAKQGDKLEIDFEVFRDKVPIENGNQKKYPITIGEGRFIPGFEEQLVGMKAGDEKEFELKFPEEYHAKNMAGKPALFKVKCNSVFEVEMPKLDDEFIKAVSGGQAQNLEALKKSIRDNLEQEEKTKQEQRLEIEMLDKIVEISEFEDIPDVLIENELHKMMHELEAGISQQGFKFEDYLKTLKKTKEDLEKEFKPQAKKRVKTAIISREIYQEQKIEVRPDEVEKEVEMIMKNYPSNPEVAKQLESETYKDYLKNVIGNRKVIDFLKKEIIQ